MRRRTGLAGENGGHLRKDAIPTAEKISPEYQERPEECEKRLIWSALEAKKARERKGREEGRSEGKQNKQKEIQESLPEARSDLNSVRNSQLVAIAVGDPHRALRNGTVTA